MTEREKLAAKLRAIRAKTVENGCTEDEAIAAAAKFAQMLEDYNFTVDEVELRASPFKQHTERHEDEVGRRLWKVAAAIADLTDTRFWVSRPGVFPFELSFFGFDHEVEIATYLLEICAGAMRREQRRILNGASRAFTARQRTRLLPFLDGMADRLHARIKALKPRQPTGTGLVVMKGALIDANMPTKVAPLKQTRPSRDADAAYRDGLAAGDRVALNRGLRGSQPQSLLLR